MADVDTAIPEALHRSNLRARRAFQYSYARHRGAVGDSMTSRTESADHAVDWKVNPPMLWQQQPPHAHDGRELGSITALTIPLTESLNETPPSMSTPAYSATKQHLRVHNNGSVTNAGDVGTANASAATQPSTSRNKSTTAAAAASSASSARLPRRSRRKSTSRSKQSRSARGGPSSTSTTTMPEEHSDKNAPLLQLHAVADGTDPQPHHHHQHGYSNNNNGGGGDDANNNSHGASASATGRSRTSGHKKAAGEPTTTTTAAVSHEHVHVAAHDMAVQHDGRAHHALAQQQQQHGHGHGHEHGGGDDAVRHYLDAHSTDEHGAQATEHHLAAAQAEGLAPVYHTEVHKTASVHDGEEDKQQQQHHHHHNNNTDSAGVGNGSAHTAAQDVHDAVGHDGDVDDSKAALHEAQDERHHPADEAAPQDNREKLHMMVQHAADPMAPHRDAMREPDLERVPRKAATDTRARVMAANIPHAPHGDGAQAAVVATRPERHRVPYLVRFRGREWARVLPKREADIRQGLVVDVTQALRVEPGDVDDIKLEMRDVMVATFVVYQPRNDAEFLRAAKKTLREHSFINVCKLYPDDNDEVDAIKEL